MGPAGFDATGCSDPHILTCAACRAGRLSVAQKLWGAGITMGCTALIAVVAGFVVKWP
jgi:hypothetical protein